MEAGRPKGFPPGKSWTRSPRRRSGTISPTRSPPCSTVSPAGAFAYADVKWSRVIEGSRAASTSLRSPAFGYSYEAPRRTSSTYSIVWVPPLLQLKSAFSRFPPVHMATLKACSGSRAVGRGANYDRLKRADCGRRPKVRFRVEIDLRRTRRVSQ